MLTRMERVTNQLVDGLLNLKDVAEDHEDRLRAVESRADVETRIVNLENRISQHDAAFTKVGERIGSVDSSVSAINAREKARISPWVAASVIAAVASAVVNIFIP